MNRLLESKFNMCNAVIAFSDANVDTLEVVPEYGVKLILLKAKVAQINAKAQAAGQVTTGITANKKQLRLKVCEHALIISGAAFAYAASVNNLDLKAQTKFCKSDFTKLQDGEVAHVALSIHNLANTHIANLEDYGVTAAVLTAFQTSITQYSNVVSAPRNAEAQIKSDNEQLQILFKEVTKILDEQMDSIMRYFLIANPAFYNEYRNNRDIGDAITIHSGIDGVVLDEANDNFLADVIVSVTVSIPVEGADDEIKTYSIVTGTDGKYLLDVPKAGIHTVKFERAGYQEKQVTEVRVKRGKRTTLDVKMIAGS